jgi:hypothetical protein
MSVQQKLFGNIEMSNLMFPVVADWSFGEVDSLDNGSKFIPVACGPNAIDLCMSNVLSPFGISNYDSQKSRKGLVLQLDHMWNAPLDCMTECLIHEISKRSQTFLGRQVDEQTVQDMYKNILKKKDNFPICITAKLTTTGTSKTRFWDMNRKRIESPTDFTSLYLNVKVCIKGLYITADQSISIIANITDCQLITTETSCPF